MILAFSLKALQENLKKADTLIDLKNYLDEISNLDSAKEYKAVIECISFILEGHSIKALEILHNKISNPAIQTKFKNLLANYLVSKSNNLEYKNDSDSLLSTFIETDINDSITIEHQRIIYTLLNIGFTIKDLKGKIHDEHLERYQEGKFQHFLEPLTQDEDDNFSKKYSPESFLLKKLAEKRHVEDILSPEEYLKKADYILQGYSINPEVTNIEILNLINLLIEKELIGNTDKSLSAVKALAKRKMFAELFTLYKSDVLYWLTNSEIPEALVNSIDDNLIDNVFTKIIQL